MSGHPARPATPVSVVIPVRDDDRELDRCLRALSHQSRAADEIIVIDNGSSDASADVARAHGARLMRCDIPGIAAAASMGYDAAAGDVILRLDADCRPDPRWIATMVDALERKPRAAAVTGGAAFIDGPRALRRPLAVAYLGAYLLAAGAALGHAPLFGSNLAMRRDAWQRVSARVHRTDPDVHDDMDLAFHLGEHHAIGLVNAWTMGISMRPFDDPIALLVRVRRGLRTVLVHWPHDFPPLRWNRLLIRRLSRARRPADPRRLA